MIWTEHISYISKSIITTVKCLKYMINFSFVILISHQDIAIMESSAGLWTARNTNKGFRKNYFSFLVKYLHIKAKQAWLIYTRKREETSFQDAVSSIDTCKGAVLGTSQIVNTI